MKLLRFTADGEDVYMSAADIACVKSSMGSTTIWLRGASYFMVDQTVREVVECLDDFA